MLEDVSLLASIRQSRNWLAPFAFLLLFGEKENTLRGKGWIAPLLLVVIGTILLLLLMTSTVAPLVLTSKDAASLTEEQQEHAKQFFILTRYWSAALTPISLSAKLVIASWVTFMMAVVLNITFSFQRIFTAFSIAALVPLLRDIVISATLRFTGVDKLADLNPPLGLDLLYSPSNAYLAALLSAITIFALWQFAVLVLYLRKDSHHSLSSIIVMALPAGLLLPVGYDVLLKLFTS